MMTGSASRYSSRLALPARSMALTFIWVAPWSRLPASGKVPVPVAETTASRIRLSEHAVSVMLPPPAWAPVPSASSFTGRLFSSSPSTISESADVSAIVPPVVPPRTSIEDAMDANRWADMLTAPPVPALPVPASIGPESVRSSPACTFTTPPSASGPEQLTSTCPASSALPDWVKTSSSAPDPPPLSLSPVAVAVMLPPSVTLPAPVAVKTMAPAKSPGSVSLASIAPAAFESIAPSAVIVMSSTPGPFSVMGA